MPTSHGVDIETATSKSFYDESEFKDYVLYLAPKVEVTKRGVVALFLLTIRVSTSGAVCWETRKHGLELELGKVTSLSTITQLPSFFRSVLTLSLSALSGCRSQMLRHIDSYGMVRGANPLYSTKGWKYH